MFVIRYQIRKIAPTRRVVFKYAIDCTGPRCGGTVDSASTYWGARYVLWKHKRAHKKAVEDIIVWEE